MVRSLTLFSPTLAAKQIMGADPSYTRIENLPNQWPWFVVLSLFPVFSGNYRVEQLPHIVQVPLNSNTYILVRHVISLIVFISLPQARVSSSEPLTVFPEGSCSAEFLSLLPSNFWNSVLREGEKTPRFWEIDPLRSLKRNSANWPL
jgi:hypothetical protein